MPYALSNRLDVTGDPLLGVTETLKVNTASFRTTAKEFRVRVKRNYGTAGGRRQPREPMTKNDKGVPRNREGRILPAFGSRVRMNLRISLLAGWLVSSCVPVETPHSQTAGILWSYKQLLARLQRWFLLHGRAPKLALRSYRASTGRCRASLGQGKVHDARFCLVNGALYPHIPISPCLKGRGSTALLVATTLRMSGRRAWRRRGRRWRRT